MEEAREELQEMLMRPELEPALAELYRAKARARLEVREGAVAQRLLPKCA